MPYIREKTQESPEPSGRAWDKLDPSSRRRRSSIIIDMDIPSFTLNGTHQKTKTSPIVLTATGIKEGEEETNIFSRKAGLGSLMKSAKQDVQVPDFDMTAFF